MSRFRPHPDEDALPLSRQRSATPALASRSRKRRKLSHTPDPDAGAGGDVARGDDSPVSGSVSSDEDEGVDEGEEGSVTYQRGNRQLDYMLNIGTHATDSSYVARQAKHDLASHLFYAETVRRGLLLPEDEAGAQAVSEAMRDWTLWPLTTAELPASYSDWTLADEVLSLVDRLAGPTQPDELRPMVDELAGASIAISTQTALDRVLRRLVLPRPSAKQARTSTSKKVRWAALPVTWRDILMAAEESGVPAQVIERTHGRLSELYRPQDVAEHRLAPKDVNVPPLASISHKSHYKPVKLKPIWTKKAEPATGTTAKSTTMPDDASSV